MTVNAPDPPVQTTSKSWVGVVQAVSLTGLGALRYGLYASKLGVGFDWGTKPGTNFRLDAYDPNNIRLDARALLRINDDFSLWLGADSLFKQTTPLIGIRLTR